MWRRLIPILVAAVALQLAACQKQVEEPSGTSGQVKVESVAGSAFKRLTLTSSASQRLGIATAPVDRTQVVRAGARADRSVVPYASIIYDKNGDTWVYTTPGPLVFVRQSVTVEAIEGDLAFLTAGPAVGTPIVTVGAAELFGVELGVGL